MAGRLRINDKNDNGSRNLVFTSFCSLFCFWDRSFCIDQAHRDLPLLLSAGIKGVCTENAHILNHKHKAERTNWTGTEASILKLHSKWHFLYQVYTPRSAPKKGNPKKVTKYSLKFKVPQTESSHQHFKETLGYTEPELRTTAMNYGKNSWIPT